jgi:hypothetical protein
MALNDETLITDDQLTVAPSGDTLIDESTLVLPPNNNGNSIESKVDAATIGQFSPAGTQVPDSDVQFIQNQIDPLRGQAPAIAGATNELFMPGFNQPLRVGGTSGQLTGSRDIFVGAGGFIPFAALERRKEAQQKAAEKRAKDLSKAQGLPKVDEIKDKRFNRNLLETSQDFISQFEKAALQRAGGDQAVARAMLTDTRTDLGRQFATQMSNLNQVAAEFNQITDDVAKIQTAMQKGGQFVSEADRQLVDDFEKMTNSFSEGDPFQAVNLLHSRERVAATRSLEGVLDDTNVLDTVKANISQTAGISPDDVGNYITTTTGRKTYEKAVDAIIPSLMRDAAIAGRFSPEQLKKELLPRFGSEITTEKTLQQKRKGSGGYNSVDDVPVSDQPKVINVGGNQYTTSVSVPASRKTQSKPVKIDGLIVIGDDGKLTTTEGISDFTLVEYSTITGADGIPRNVARGQVTTIEKGPTGKEIKTVKDVTADYNNVKGSIKGLSTDAKFSAEAFENVASGANRNKLLVDKENVRGQFLEGFNASGFESVDDYVEALSQEGNDIVLNDEARKIINSDQFLGSAKRIKESKSRRR